MFFALSTWLLIFGSAIVASFAACFDKQADCSCCKSGECANPGDETYSCSGCIEGYTGHDCREPCPESCVNCSQNYFNGNRTCFACTNGFYNGKPENISYHPPQNDCSLSCMKGCELCVSYTQCTRCKDGFYMSKNGVLMGNSVCIPCQDHCKTCVSGSSCTECDFGLFLERSECKLCESGCISCNDSNRCNECHKGLYLHNGRCVDCVAGYWGKTCEHKCTTGCRDNVCHSQNGSCTLGCQDKYIQNGDGFCVIEEKHVAVPHIVGPVVGACVLIIITVLLGIFVRRRRKTQNSRSYIQVPKTDIEHQANSVDTDRHENGLGILTERNNSDPSEQNVEQFANDNSEDENDGLTQEKLQLNVEQIAKGNPTDGNDGLTRDKQQGYGLGMSYPESPKEDNSKGQHINEDTFKHDDDKSADTKANQITINICHSTTENKVIYSRQPSVKMQDHPETILNENKAERTNDEHKNRALKHIKLEYAKIYGNFPEDSLYLLQEKTKWKTINSIQEINTQDKPTNENTTTKMHVSKLPEYLKDKTSQDFKNEFKQTEPSRMDNNRNNEKLSKQVILKTPFSAIYLQAFHVEGINKYNKQDKYIAYSDKISTNMLGVTWEMVWQNNVGVIVTLCKQSEKRIENSNNCDQFWPQINLSKEYKDIDLTATCLIEERRTLFTIREFSIRKAGELERVVKQLQCAVWTEKGVPNDISDLEKIQQEVSKIQLSIGGLTCTLVHSSTDLCHAGVFIAFDNLTKECSAENSVDVVSCVRELRLLTSSMIKEKQYEYLYRAIAHACTFKNTP